MAERAVDDLASVWLHALLFRWPDHAAPEHAPAIAPFAERLGRFGVELAVIGGPDGLDAGVPQPELAVAVAQELDRLAGRAIGHGLIGAVGDLPGLPARVVRTPGGFDALEAAVEGQLQLRRRRRVPAIDNDPTWTLEAPTDDPLLIRVVESLYTLADGRFGTRGSTEDPAPGSDPLVVAAGAYMAGRGAGLDATPTLLPGPLWFQLDLPDASADSDRRILDLRTGLLLREVTRGGHLVRIVRFACSSRPGTAVLRAEGPPEALTAGPALTVPDADLDEFRTSSDGWVATSRSDRASIVAVAHQETHDEPDRRVVDRRVSLRRIDPDAPTPATADERGRRDAGRFEDLLEEHRATWAQRWNQADVAIEGDDQLQVAVRLALFHLMQSVASDGEAAVGARGLSGRAYRGHVFWDADVFVLPFLAATHAAAARAMLAYRLARLPAARALAAQDGRAGARFPWESADDGTDVTPTSAVVLGGRTEPILSGPYQEHITADVAWAACHYLAWTADHTFEASDARLLLIETARYWRDRVSYDRMGRAHVLGVMGPDEYHAPVDDNAFTNGMARFNLRRAAAVVARRDSARLRREAAQWRRLAEDIVDGYDERTGRHEQFVGYDSLEPMTITDLAEPPVAADILLGLERVAHTQLIKQADALMLHHLLPRGRPPGSLERDLEHYLPRTAHGSSLSPGIHAAVLARAGRPDEAVPWLELAAYLDIDDITGSTAGGLHIAAMGSVWQALAYGFLGLWPERSGALSVDPALPSDWDALSMRVTYRGNHLVLRAEHERFSVACSAPVTLRVGAAREHVTPPGASFQRTGPHWLREAQ